LDELSLSTPGSFVEVKPMTLAWHYRNVEPELARERTRELAPRLAALLEQFDLEVIQGAKVLEVRPRGLDKGLILSRVLAGPAGGRAIVAIGDDRTDEDLFAVLPSPALTIHVGNGPSRAAYRLPDVGAVRRFLRSFLA